MGVLYDALLELSPDGDKELLEGYRFYESVLEGVLTPEQMATYAESIRQSKTVTVLDELTADQIAALPPEQISLVTAILAVQDAVMENRRVAALRNQRGLS